MFNDSVFEKVEIIGRGEIVETKNDSTILISQKIILTSFDKAEVIIFHPSFLTNIRKQMEFTEC